jgi:hypothetical protein
MDAVHWRMYRGIATLSELATESALALEKCLQLPDNSSEIRKVLDRLIYKAIAEAREVLPHALTYAEAVFQGVQYPAAVDATSPSQHGMPSFQRSSVCRALQSTGEETPSGSGLSM